MGQEGHVAEEDHSDVETTISSTNVFGQPMRLTRRRSVRTLVEAAIRGFLFLCAAVSIATTISIIAILLFETIAFLQAVPLTEFLFGTTWAPLFSPPSYGVLPLVTGTLVTSLIAMLVAVPIGLLAAIYLSEYAGPRLRGTLKPILEILAGIPTVVYGYFALTFITPALREVIPGMKVFNGLSAGLVMGIMIIPLVSSLSEDALNAVPNALREGAYGLGATKLEVTLRTVVPAALSGIAAAFILAISRAIGETMIVLTAAGQSTSIQPNPLGPMETMTAYIARVSTGDVAHQGVEYQTLFAVGMLLFVITFILNLISNRFVRKYRQVYQ